LTHLKDEAAEKLNEAEEKLHDLADKAKGVWNKMTGHRDEEKK